MEICFTEGVQFSGVDKFPKLLNDIQNKFIIDRRADEEIIYKLIHKVRDIEGYTYKFSSFYGYPSKFLAPWIPFNHHYDTEDRSQLPDYRGIYSLDLQYITINSIWREYLLEHYDDLIYFTETSLKTYLKIYKSSSIYNRFYKTRFMSLNLLTEAIQERKDMPDVKQFCIKFDLPLHSKLIPADILDRVPESNYTIDRNGQKHIDVKEGQWSLKMLELIFAKI